MTFLCSFSTVLSDEYYDMKIFLVLGENRCTLTVTPVLVSFFFSGTMCVQTAIVSCCKKKCVFCSFCSGAVVDVQFLTCSSSSTHRSGGFWFETENKDFLAAVC